MALLYKTHRQCTSYFNMNVYLFGHSLFFFKNNICFNILAFPSAKNSHFLTPKLASLPHLYNYTLHP